MKSKFTKIAVVLSAVLVLVSSFSVVGVACFKQNVEPTTESTTAEETTTEKATETTTEKVVVEKPQVEIPKTDAIK